MKKIIAPIIILLLFVLPQFHLKASHYMGGYITYECIVPDSFRVHLIGYRNCAGVSGIPTSVFLDSLGSNCGTVTMQSAWTTVSIVDITPVAPGVITNCVSPTSIIQGVEEHHYTKDYGTSNANCDFVLSFSTCCRNVSIGNINSNSNFYLYADTIRVGATTCNSSPQWNSPIPGYFTANSSYISNQSATDPDGDSLVYSLTSCLVNSNTPVAYNPGFSATTPMGSDYSVSLNSATGIMSITPLAGGNGVYAIAIKAEEYRNGVKIGEIIRESILTFLPATGCSTTPEFTGLTNLQGGAAPTPNTFPTDTIHLSVAAGSPFCVDITTNDPDVNNANILSSFLLNSGATFTDTNNANPNYIYDVNPIGRYCWTPPTPGTYQEVFTLQDTACLGLGYVSVLLNITVGDTAKVWPGDANNDLIANNFDLLSLGLAFGSTGPARATISNTWTGKNSLAWGDTIPGPIDKKFQDCDGSGLVDADDTLAISLNYGFTHMKNRSAAERGQATDPPLYMSIPDDSASAGDTLHVPIFLGDSLINVANVYGIAFSLNYDAALIDSTSFSIEFSPSWIGNNSNSLSMNRNNFTLATCDGAQVRTNHQATSGMGQIATAHFIIIDNIDGKRQTFETATLTLDFANVRVIGLNGEQIPVDPISDSLTVYQLITDAHPNGPHDFDLQLFPNPANEQITIETQATSIQEIQIWNLQGQMLSRNTLTDQKSAVIQLADFAPGMYFVKVRTPYGLHSRRLVLRR